MKGLKGFVIAMVAVAIVAIASVEADAQVRRGGRVGGPNGLRPGRVGGFAAPGRRLTNAQLAFLVGRNRGFRAGAFRAGAFGVPVPYGVPVQPFGVPVPYGVPVAGFAAGGGCYCQ